MKLEGMWADRSLEQRELEKFKDMYRITDLISDFGIASMLNYTTNPNLVTKFMVWFNMEAMYSKLSLIYVKS